MQPVIYADILVAMNSVITFLMLLTTSDILRIDSRKPRFIAGAVTGGIFSLVIIAPSMNLFLVIITRLIMCIAIVLITFPVHSLKKVIKCICGFFLISILYAGFVIFISWCFNSRAMVYNNGFTYTEMSAFTLIAVITAIYFVVRAVNKKVLSKQHNDYIFCVSVIYKDKEIKTKALFDSGNKVCDVYFGRPVIIVSFEEIKDFFDAEDIQIIKALISGKYSLLAHGFRLMPLQTLGEKKLLPAFTARQAIVSNEYISKTVNEPCIVISSDTFGENKYGALINESVLGMVI